MNIPKDPDPDELTRLLDTLESRIELRAYEDNVAAAYDVLSRLQSELERILNSQTKHRDWRAGRPKVAELVDELNRILL